MQNKYTGILYDHYSMMMVIVHLTPELHHFFFFSFGIVLSSSPKLGEKFCTSSLCKGYLGKYLTPHDSFFSSAHTCLFILIMQVCRDL